MVILFVHSAFALVSVSVAVSNLNEDTTIKLVKICVSLWLMFVVILHAPVVCLQLKSQCGKLLE